MCVNSYPLKMYLWELRPGWKCVPLWKNLALLLLPGRLVHCKPRITLTKFGAWGFFLMHTYETSLPSEHSPRFGDGYPHCLFSVGSIFFFFQFNHFPSSHSGNSSFMCFQSKLAALLGFNPDPLHFARPSGIGRCHQASTSSSWTFFWSGALFLSLTISLSFLTSPCL